ncbi:MAG: VWA domain-containing protein, partial [Phycisphaerales bacterium]|nr:VWA domain-containing protein [Phycisphaerales bacterium]
MNWVTPTTGLLFAAVTIPALLLLYFLRLRRQTLNVPSTMLWQQSIEDLHANTPFQRLRPSSLLLLQMLALLLVILAIMQPQIKGAAPKEGNHVVLIDTSSSMLAKDFGGKTRLDVAKEQAIELVSTLHGGGLFAGDGGKTMVISFSESAVVVSPFSDSKQQLVNAIESIKPTNGLSDASEALTLARAYTTNTNPEEAGLSASESAQLELFSDGRIEGLTDAALQRGETIVYHAIGSPKSSNVGVYNLSVSRLDESSDEIQTFLSLVNSGSENVVTDVTLMVD